MNTLGQDEKAIYFTAPVGGVECLSATFKRHRYQPHAHDTFVVGALSHGTGTIFIRGRNHAVRAGDLTLYNPFEVHDGAPANDGFSYRVSYPSTALLREIATESTSLDRAGTPTFREPIVHDPRGAALFFAAHRLWEEKCSQMEAQERLLCAYVYCLSVHAGVRFPRSSGERGPIARIVELLSERFAERLTLEELAIEAGLSRQRLIRAFHRRTGMTPHAFLVNRRVDAAKAMLRSGFDPLSAAMATGFSDQAHLTRIFKARVGVPPGAYRAAFAA
ncbi:MULTISPECIES: AraC family transcriptional regulator [unclassified Mesorhizobium]|uniref:AraC family transcriptional regulator n=1 Tax=unclassified Mesorhizobium TaxID=325217 RepID=UPI002416BE0D|nr:MULTISPECIES: AraC family transcriptional regulator [unclassified Mesorhizobium]WFP64918.1 AraC family transcriptional regulator [Mesorhizobium sp. WSM4904]WFP78191.1 AraC family transcriptional regulator [Mesorhizobium sp. WSM4906]